LIYSEANGHTTAKNIDVVQSTLTYAATTDVDFSGDAVKTISLTGNIEFTTSNKAAGRQVTVIITCDGTPRTFVFPAWVFVGAAAPTGVAASKKAVLTLYCSSTTDASIVAAYAEQP